MCTTQTERLPGDCNIQRKMWRMRINVWKKAKNALDKGKHVFKGARNIITIGKTVCASLIWNSWRVRLEWWESFLCLFLSRHAMLLTCTGMLVECGSCERKVEMCWKAGASMPGNTEWLQWNKSSKRCPSQVTRASHWPNKQSPQKGYYSPLKLWRMREERRWRRKRKRKKKGDIIIMRVMTWMQTRQMNISAAGGESNKVSRPEWSW